MTPLGTKKINKLLLLDYVDGRPITTFRAEIDIPLGHINTYNALKKLLDASPSSKRNRAIVDKLLKKLGKVPSAASAIDQARNKAARRFVAAAFDVEADVPVRRRRGLAKKPL